MASLLDLPPGAVFASRGNNGRIIAEPHGDSLIIEATLPSSRSSYESEELQHEATASKADKTEVKRRSNSIWTLLVTLIVGAAIGAIMVIFKRNRYV